MPRKDTVASDQFDKRIQIQDVAEADDGQGGRTETWNTIYSPMADIQNYPRGRGLSRLFKFMQLYPEANVIVVIRYVPNLNINAKMRILSVEHGTTHEYRIVGPPQNLNRANVSIYIPCKELQAKGVN